MFKLTTFSLKNRALIALISIFAAIFGVIAVTSLKQEIIPSVELPRISVVTSISGTSPEVMDAQVAQPLSAALGGVENLDSADATSNSGLTVITLSLKYGANLDRARSQVDRAISTTKQQLPSGADPQVIAGSVNDFPIMYISASSDQSPSQLASDLKRVAVPQLQKLDGVRGAEVSGANGKHVEIQPDPAKLGEAGMPVTAISDAIKNNGTVIPAGTITNDGKTFSVQIGSAVNSLDKIRALPLGGDKGATIGSVAEVSLQDDKQTSITRTNGVETLSVSVTKKPEAGTVDVSHRVNGLLPELTQEMGNNTQFTVVSDQAPYIERSIEDLTTEGLLGLGFAILVILVFLFSIRSTVITAISIPLSLLITLIALWGMKYSLNVFTLGALTIAIGRVVDDSIVVIENIKRHLDDGESRMSAITTAVKEVAGAITSSTLTTVAVFLPIAFVGDLIGELFRPFALTVSIALAVSLLVSLTIIPVLAYWFLRPSTKKANPTQQERTENVEAAESQKELDRLQKGYLPALRTTQRHPVITLIASVLILVGTLGLTFLLPLSFLGNSGQNSFTMKQTMPQGTSLDATSQAAQEVERTVKDVDGVENVQVTIGNASGNFAAYFGGGGSSTANYIVITREKIDQTALQNTVRSKVEELQNVGTIALGSQGFGGTSSTVDVVITANNAEELATANAAVLEAMKDTPNARDVTSNLAGAVPVVQVEVDRIKATAAGVSEQQLSGILAATVNPIPAGNVRLDSVNYKVQIGQGTQFNSIEELGNAMVPTANGPVPLSSLATVKQVQLPPSVTSKDGQRTAKVSLTPVGDNLAAVTQEVNKRLQNVSLPSSADAVLGGISTQQQDSFQQLGLALLAAIVIVYIVMVATFKSLVQPLILLVSIPFAATGAVGLLLITRVPLGIPAMIGMLMLVGIVVTNAIVLIDLINQYRQRGMNVPEAIEEGARYRLRPILMTALATVFALLPMALGVTGGGGGFISQSLAIVVIGGLVSSTALTLILVPVLYRLVEGGRENRREGRLEKKQAKEAFDPSNAGLAPSISKEAALEANLSSELSSGATPRRGGKHAGPASSKE